MIDGRTAAALVTVVGVVLPTVRMARIASTSSRLQYSDYWHMIDDVLNRDGSTRWEGLLVARNGHPVVVPKLLYLFNVTLTDGSNHGLAALVFVIALGLVGLVALMAHGTPGLGRWGRVSIVVASAFAVMASQGAWSFVKAMSGGAWLTANLFIVAALVAQQRDRRIAAVVLGLVASISYGTGLAVWPALVVAGLLRDGKRWRVQWPVWAAGAIVLGLYVRWRLANPLESGSSEPLEVIRNVVSLLAAPLVPDLAGIEIVLAIAAVVATAAALVACRDRLRDAAPWVGLIVFASLATLIIARARPLGGAASDDSIPSRYWSITLWFWVGLLGLALVALRGRSWRPVVSVLLIVMILADGMGDVPDYDGSTQNNDLLAVAIVTDMAEGRRIAGGFSAFPRVSDDLRARGHHPFDGSFSPDCGLFGRTVEVEPTLPPEVEGEVANEPRRGHPGLIHFAGSLQAPGGHVECIVVVDGTGEVVGAASFKNTAGSYVRFRALAPGQFFLTVAVRVDPDGPFHAIPKKP